VARVLLVEDDPVVARVLEMALSRAGHQVYLVKDFPTAKERRGSLKPGTPSSWT
jgi:DNA-binding response OmpR family regulator